MLTSYVNQSTSVDGGMQRLKNVLAADQLRDERSCSSVLSWSSNSRIL